MKTVLLSLSFAAACCAVSVPATAQTAVAAMAASAASSPSTARPQPRPLSPSEQRDSATTPGDVRPVDPVIPQISVPLGRTPPEPVKSKAEAQRQRKTAAAGGVDDGVARCKAQVTSDARMACMERLQRTRRAP